MEKFSNDINTKPIQNDAQSKNELLVSIYGKNSNKKINNNNVILQENKNHPPKKKYSLIGDGLLMESRKSQSKRVFEEIMKEEKEEKKEEKKDDEVIKNNEDELLKLKEQYENEIRQLKEKNEKDLKKLKQEKDKEIKKLKKELEKQNLSKSKQNLDDDNNTATEIDALRITLPLSSLFTDQEINSMDLKKSLSYDKRSYFLIYYSFINMKQPLFFLFNYYTTNRKPNFQIKLNSLRIIIFCYEIMIYLFLYASFFGSKSITNKFNGVFNFGKKCALGIIIAPFCMIIKSVIHYFTYNYINKHIVDAKLKCYSFFILEKRKLYLNKKEEISNINEVYTNVKNVYENNKYEAQKKYLNNEFIYSIQALIDIFKIKLFIFFGLSILIMFFEWCLVASFCSVYKNSQIEFFLSIIICYFFANIIAFIYCFIPTTLRYYAIKKKSSLLFTFAEITKII